jgi:hypothetical protein
MSRYTPPPFDCKKFIAQIYTFLIQLIVGISNILKQIYAFVTKYIKKYYAWIKEIIKYIKHLIWPNDPPILTQVKIQELYDEKECFYKTHNDLDFV